MQAVHKQAYAVNSYCVEYFLKWNKGMKKY